MKVSMNKWIEWKAAVIEIAIQAKRVERWLVHTDPAGGTTIWMLDSADL
jgi:hypothetical protein